MVTFVSVLKSSSYFRHKAWFVLFVILDQPDKPGAPQVVDWDSGNVDLSWNPPRRDGGAPITGYIIEKKPKNSPIWEEAARVEGKDTRATVPGLKDGEEYEFRVTAVNKAGPSEPSEPCAPFLARPKYCKFQIVSIWNNCYWNNENVNLLNNIWI